MKLLVSVKRVIDPYVNIRIKPDASGVVNDHVKMTMNPFDEVALEEALRLKDANVASEVVVVSVGDDTNQETLRSALAMGADRAILIQTMQHYSGINLAIILKKIILDGDFDLVIMGKQSIDGDNNQTPQMLAGLLNWPQATNASSLTKIEQGFRVVRDVDAGLETVELSLPAIISVDLHLNKPRYITLPNLMKAKKKPINIHPLESLGLTLKSRHKIINTKAPIQRQAGLVVDSVDALFNQLIHDNVL